MEQRIVPDEIGPTQVLVRMTHVGICGSDVHYWTKGGIGDFRLTSPMVIGHEGAGTIEKVGSQVHHLVAGDRVALEPGIPCRTCTQCKQGCYNMCPEVRFFATPPIHGCLSQHVIHEADFCFKLPENVSSMEGALVEPASVAIYAADQTFLSPGKSCLIMGAGPIGLLTALVARAYGAYPVIICDVNAHNLTVANSLGLDHTFHITNLSSKETAQLLVDLVDTITGTSSGGFDCGYECCGVESATQTLIYASRPNGHLCLIGMGASEMKVPLLHAAFKQVRISGIRRYCNTYAKCITMMATQTLQLSALVTHRFPMSAYQQAFETARDSAQHHAIKVMFEL